ncbi:MAG: hypothetical protein EI684_04910 [Candidatus Viridilinea halotolerans]|uniref:Uncharacterized protein n=1 Tax=Candidatus Viridilinea halotolerans TaxID=2491704 RepID=A0A426U5V8_9CHLR|nr:MAG: hypothetical protein EI684_04910 [Candidatus Viridilinea halotolerans]
MDENLDECISNKMVVGQYAEAARLAATLDNVSAKESWFERIAEAQVAAYVKQMEVEDSHQGLTILFPLPSWVSVTVRHRRPTLIQEKSAYDNAHV